MSMILILHIVLALGNLLLASLALLAPSVTKLNVTYGLTAATLVSGSYLVWQLHSPLVSSCATGLVYLSVVTVLSGLARRRMFS